MTPPTSGSLHGAPRVATGPPSAQKVLNKTIGLVLFLAELKTVDLIGQDVLTESKADCDQGLIGMMVNELEMTSDLLLAAIKADIDGKFFDKLKASCDKFKANGDKLKDANDPKINGN
jgi:hypothetical protein